MSLHHTAQRAPKTLGESAICFAFTAAALVALTVGLQWLFGLVL
ncbi:hypothetical protein [Phenylobacterium sp.]|nr:hypothetical protein [Phenylobacterium sp.]MDP3852874.1 hypothetical protein [Phenylobacterium sp.]